MFVLYQLPPPFHASSFFVVVFDMHLLPHFLLFASSQRLHCDNRSRRQMEFFCVFAVLLSHLPIACVLSVLLFSSAVFHHRTIIITS